MTPAIVSHMIVEEARDLAGTDTKVIYRPYPGAPPEEGVVVSVNPTSRLVFVRYGADITAKATRAEDLTRMTP